MRSSARRRRILRWKQVKNAALRQLARSRGELTSFTDEKVKEIAAFNALFEPADLNLVSGAKGRAGPSVILT
jgi:hypothetical protein